MDWIVVIACNKLCALPHSINVKQWADKALEDLPQHVVVNGLGSDSRQNGFEDGNQTWDCQAQCQDVDAHNGQKRRCFELFFQNHEHYSSRWKTQCQIKHCETDYCVLEWDAPTAARCGLVKAFEEFGLGAADSCFSTCLVFQRYWAVVDWHEFLSHIVHSLNLSLFTCCIGVESLPISFYNSADRLAPRADALPCFR